MINKISKKYIEYVENKISPQKIAKAYQGAEILRKIPLFFQKKIVSKESRKDPYMGFVVEPYSFFLAYEISETMVKNYIPSNYELIPISLFENSPQKKCAIIGCFNVHTSVFSGSRFELYIIARNIKTNLVSWLICDYESNTINYDAKQGFLLPTLTKSIFTTSYKGDLICNIQGKENTIDFIVNTEKYSCQKLNKRLWIEGNLSIDYSGNLNNGGQEPFGLIFDPDEMAYGHSIENENLHINSMNFSFINNQTKPFEICLFKYAQHYITTKFQRGHEMKNEKDLESAIINIIDKR